MEKTFAECQGEKIGFLIGYALFTIILFLILTFLDKIPSSWSYFHIIGITLILTLTGTTIKRSLQ